MSSRQERRKKEILEQIGGLKRQFLQSKGEPFGNLLDTRVLQKLVEEECGSFRSRIFSPIITLWAFLTQVLEEDHSCRKAVSTVQVWLAEKKTPQMFL